ncbi:MAG: ATPase, T2SS/T4P/T4SS family [Candidatus Micrarchaeota archaeon]
MLGWRILSHGQYKLDLPPITKEEAELITCAEERFREATRLRAVYDREESRKLVQGIVERAADDSGVFLDRSQREYMGRVAFMHIYGVAFMEPILEDPEVEEISVVGPRKPVYVYLRKKGWRSVNACFDDERTIADMVNRMARPLGRHITMQNPRLDAVLPDGSRLHASLVPVSCGEITVRKFRERPFSPRELVEAGTVSAGGMALLSVLMQCDFSVIVAGNTASGKTTTMNSLFSFVPATERIIIAEETPEINVPHGQRLRLVANRELGVSLRDLVYDSLRMRPDRMIVGEVRNREECEALFDVLLAGQARGSYATFHAQSADEALSRLQSFGARKEDLSSIDCIIVQRRMLEYDAARRSAREVRGVVEMAEVVRGEAEPFYRGGKLAKPPGLLERAAGSFGLGKNEMARELERRRKLIMRAGPAFGEFFREVQAEFFGAGPGGGGEE